jgi:hypothetical protein
MEAPRTGFTETALLDQYATLEWLVSMPHVSGAGVITRSGWQNIRSARRGRRPAPSSCQTDRSGNNQAQRLGQEFVLSRQDHRLQRPRSVAANPGVRHGAMTGSWSYSVSGRTGDFHSIDYYRRPGEPADGQTGYRQRNPQTTGISKPVPVLRLLPITCSSCRALLQIR